MLITLLLLPSLVKVAVVGYYYANIDMIANELCIEKDIEESTCDGKCYLNEQIKKVDNTDSEQIPKFVSFKDLSPFYCPQTIKETFEENKKIVYSDYMNNYTYNFSIAIFHPPISLLSVTA